MCFCHVGCIDVEEDLRVVAVCVVYPSVCFVGSHEEDISAVVCKFFPFRGVFVVDLEPGVVTKSYEA